MNLKKKYIFILFLRGVLVIYFKSNFFISFTKSNLFYPIPHTYSPISAIL